MSVQSPPLMLGTYGGFYLGTPGAMNRLQMPDAGYSVIASRGEVVQTLLSGGTVVNRVIDTKRQWPVAFSSMSPDAANLLVAFYAGSMGPAPYNLWDPAWRNALSDYASSFGVKVTTVTGWALSITGTQTLTYNTSVAEPNATSGSGLWVGAGNGSKIAVATSFATSTRPLPDPNSAPLYLSDTGQGGSLYVRTVSSTASLTLNVNAYDAAGNVVTTGSSGTATASSAGWTRLSSFLASGGAGLYTIPVLTCNTAGAPNILVCCADVQYNMNSIADLEAWVLGLGSPRVVISSGLPSNVRILPYRDQAMTFSEI